jgi:hypothetical protein
MSSSDYNANNQVIINRALIETAGIHLTKCLNFFRERNFRMNPSYGLVKMYFTKQTGIWFFPQEIGWKRFDHRKEQRSIARPIAVHSATSS